MTARIPGAKRGRPAKPKLPKPKRDAGRPEIPLSGRPERYLLAHYEAFVSMGFSRRKAAQVLELLYKGPLTDISVADEWPYCITLKVRPTTEIDLEEFAKDCDALRALVKFHAAKPDDLALLMTMAEAVRIAMGPWRPDGGDIILRLTSPINETAWAREVLLPILRASKPARSRIIA